MTPQDLVGKTLKVVDLTDDGDLLVEDISHGSPGNYIILRVKQDEQYGAYFHPSLLVEKK